MTSLRHILICISIITTLTGLAGCSLGMLLFYKDSKTVTVYKSADSGENYFKIEATTLSHCGCTDLNIYNYRNGKKEFSMFYNGNIAIKTIYKFNDRSNRYDTLRLRATPDTNFTTSLDSIDIAVFNRIDSIAIQTPKGIVYPVKKTSYKGYIADRWD